MKLKLTCQFCGVKIDGEGYQRDSEYSTVTSCVDPDCMVKADERIEEIMEEEHEAAEEERYS